MTTDFKLTTRGYIQNAGDSTSQAADVELSGNPEQVNPGTETFARKPAGDYVVLRMLDAKKLGSSDHRISHIGLTLTLDEAESLATWLSNVVSEARKPE